MNIADEATKNMPVECSANSSEVIVIEDGEIDDSKSEIPVNPIPIFEVVFTKESDFKKYGQTIIKVLKQHLVFDGKQLDFSTSSDREAMIEDNGIDDKYAQVRILAFEPEEIKLEPEKHTTIENDENNDQNSNDSIDFGVDLNNLFTIDPSPSTSLESAKVPSYKRVIKEFLDDKIEEKPKEAVEACPRPKSKASCFNCGSFDHGLRDCHLPRSAKRINRAKKARTSKGERYHVDVDQRFAHLRPGVISEKLKKALRLRHGELPSFFYRMRVCGYPPGWLEDAKVSDSGLAMFNSGDDVLKSEESYENPSDIKYDISKIIEFPGFNTSPGSNFYDDYKHYNVPPLNRSYMREEMIKALGDSAIKGFKRRKVKDDAIENAIPSVTESAIVAEHDMEIEDADVTLPENTEIEYTRPMPPPLPPGLDDNDLPPLPPTPIKNSPSPPISPLDEERSRSPTLDELQARQRALLMKLECGDDFQIDDELKLDISNCMENPSAPDTIVTPETPSTPVLSDTELKKIIKSSHMGTPVLQFSPFEKLPSGENFKVGVSDVINFENLPDSTGKYETMKDVLKKVRNIKQQLDAEDD